MENKLSYMKQDDNNIYIKERGRYRPIGYHFSAQNDWLTEGVWVVLKKPHSMETINGNYLKSLYGIDKMSDLKDFTFAELGDIHKTAEDMMLRFPKDWNSHPRSLIELVCMTLSCLKDIQKK